ncbi:MAG: GerMN domain-containing protein [Firmicutes bacterium]|nr:GerMN domain-containing protein [Bacillota bacterium]
MLIVGVGGLLRWRSRRPVPPALPSPTPRPPTTMVTLYYINRAYVERGDERLPHLLPEKRRLAPATEGGLAAAAVSALQTAPSSPRAMRVIREDLKVRGVWVEDGVAYVDFARTNLFGGSLEEILMVQGTVKTLTGLPGITSVRFLVEGRPAETLMGHVAVDQPLKPEDVF